MSTFYLEGEMDRREKKKKGFPLAMKKSSSKATFDQNNDVPAVGSAPVHKKTLDSKLKKHKKSHSVEVEKKGKETEKKKKKKKSKKNKTDEYILKEKEEEKKRMREEKGKEKEREEERHRVSSSESDLEENFLISQNYEDEDYEDDGEDFIGDFVFREEQPEKPFVCLQEGDIAKEQEKEIEKISELLQVSLPQAAGLLRFYKWNKDKLLTKFFDDPEGVLELAGVKVKSDPQPGCDEMGIMITENRCSICDEEASEDLQLFALECNHFFCSLCWDQYLSMKITEGQSGLIPCPSYDCGLLMDEKFVKKLVSEEIYAKYVLFLTKSFVDGNSQVRWCPAPGCGNAVNTDSPVGQTVHCSCGHSFCFRCGEEPHGPAHCEQVRDWNKKSQDESETNNWINANTQACPKCNSYTEKNGGCNHMTCKNCGHEYCWMCKKDWKGHYDFYTCNRFEKKSKKSKKTGGKKGKVDKEAQAALEKEEHRQRLERYLHYYNQFMELDKMLGTVAKTREKINAKFKEWRDNDGTVAESLFVEKALNILTTCWRALKWSCVRLYYFGDNNIRKNLFEFVKTDLEKSVNMLSEILRESPFEKSEVLDLTRLCETRLTNLLSWHNTCR